MIGDCLSINLVCSSTTRDWLNAIEKILEECTQRELEVCIMGWNIKEKNKALTCCAGLRKLFGVTANSLIPRHRHNLLSWHLIMWL